MASADRHFVSIAQAADHVGVTVKTVRRWIAAGRLTGYRAGPRLIRVDRDEFDAVLRPMPNANGGAA